MDGNGRWAHSKGHARVFGHVRGAKVAKSIIEHAAHSGIEFLTLFAFSSENWSRPQSEVAFLMKLLTRQMHRELHELKKNNIRFRAIGNLEKLPRPAREAVEKAIHETAQNTGMTLFFALSYGGRPEIVKAAQKLAQAILDKKLLVHEISESNFAQHLETAHVPDPDLVIRTSGEMRISNFMLWQIAYSELVILKKHWPEFTHQDFDLAISEYQSRERRFGKVVTPHAPTI
jgi:undecaprenyl diphosphate synthase